MLLPARLTPVMQAFLDGAIAATDGEARRTLLAFASGSGSQEALAALCSPVYARALDSLLRDTISPNVLHGGVKYNVIPGEAILDIDVLRAMHGDQEVIVFLDAQARAHI